MLSIKRLRGAVSHFGFGQGTTECGDRSFTAREQKVRVASRDRFGTDRSRGSRGSRGGVEAPSQLSIGRADELDAAETEHACSLCPDLLSACDADEAAALCRALLRDDARARLGAEAAALRHDCVAGRLACPFDDDNAAVAQVVRDGDRPDAADLTEAEFLSFAGAALLRATLLRALLLRAAGDEAGDEGGGGEARPRRRCAALLGHDYFLEQFAALVYDCALARSLHDGYAFVSAEPLALVSLLSPALIGRRAVRSGRPTRRFD